jgi:hypothetical protein
MGLKEGYWKFYCPNGSVSAEGYFSKNKKQVIGISPTPMDQRGKRAILMLIVPGIGEFFTKLGTI